VIIIPISHDKQFYPVMTAELPKHSSLLSVRFPPYYCVRFLPTVYLGSISLMTAGASKVTGTITVMTQVATVMTQIAIVLTVLLKG
jgi:hypothetical protein